MPVRLPKRFQFVREIGRGGMGAVFEAIDTEKTIREQCAGKTAEIVVGQMYAFLGYFHLGEFGAVASRHPSAVREAIDRRDMFGAINLRIGTAT